MADMFDLFLISAALVVASLALFVLPSIPRWIWPLLLFATFPGELHRGLPVKPPTPAAKACVWNCAARYPNGGHFVFPSFRP